MRSSRRKLTSLSQRNIDSKHCPAKHIISFNENKSRKNEKKNSGHTDSIT